MHVALELDYVRELPRGDVRAATDRPPRKTGKRVRVFLCERDRLFQRTAQSMKPKTKTPRGKGAPRGVLRLRSFAFRRSQDEVAVDAEGEGPVVLVLDGVDAGGPFRARACARRAEDAEPGEPGVHLGVPDIHAHVA